MKTFLALSLHLLITSFLFAQSPLGIPYQAVMRNADGTVMASSAVNLIFMIHDGTTTGNVVFQESHALTSNAQGLVSCVVGNGVVSQGNFANINWGNGAKFLHVMMGTTDMGTQQLLSVPYALYSNGVNLSVSPTGDTLTIGNQTVIVPGISAANANNNTIPTSGLGAVVLPGNNTCADQFINVVGCNGQTSLTYDGRTYDLVEIGGQCWFADNLATDQYRNGDAIPTGLDNASWSTTTSGAYAIYNNDPTNDATYGKLYNWFTTVDNRGLCPSGWHVPSDCEWMYLEGSLGMSVVDQLLVGLRGNNVGGTLKSSVNWTDPNSGALNSFGFSALPGGDRYFDGVFYTNGFYYHGIGVYGSWWSRTDDLSGHSWYRDLYYNSGQINRNTNLKQNGFSIRCLKDSEAPVLQGCTDGSACNFLANATQDDGSCLYPNATCDDGDVNTVNDVINGECVCVGAILPPPLFTMGNGVTDIDGNFYPSIIINGQEWMQKNLAVTKYRNGNEIPTNLAVSIWGSTTIGSYSVYNDEMALVNSFGNLYNWYAVTDARGLCPTLWHVPSELEWSLLENSLGGSALAGGKLKSLELWEAPNIGATNESGFNGLPGGYRSPNYNALNQNYGNFGFVGNWWTSTERDSGNAWLRALGYHVEYVNRDFNQKQFGFSIRCLKD